MDTPVGFEWSFTDRNDADLALLIAKEVGGRAELKAGRQSILPVIPIIAGGMLLVQLAGMVLRFAKDARGGGIIIDARERPVKITQEKDLDRGKVIVINAKGEKTTFVDAKTKDELAEILKNALSVSA